MADVVEIMASVMRVIKSGPRGKREERHLPDDAARAAVQNAITALHNAGFVIVPREPDEGMIEASIADWRQRVQDKFEGKLAFSDHKYALIATYRAMIEASQK